MTNRTFDGTGKKTRRSTIRRILAILCLPIGLAGCGDTLQRLAEIGDGPQVSPIVNPTTRKDYRPVSLPMPAPRRTEDNPNSLWRNGARAFFKDIRAKEVGDIVTVQLNINDQADLDNETNRARVDSEAADVDAFLGFETNYAQVFQPTSGAATTGNLLNFSNNHTTEGDGDILRTEVIDLTVAAVVTQILPNGNLVITGRQEVTVNSELRELVLTGVIRPQDIDTDNIITHDKIAEMRVAYGGRGTLSGLQEPRWGTQVWDILFPF